MNKTLIIFLRSALRRASMRWKPIYTTRNAARRLYKGPNKRQKYEYKCAKCKKHYPNKKIQVDHITPVGSLKTLSDLPGFVGRLFCAVDGLQVLCLVCHKTKSSGL